MINEKIITLEKLARYNKKINSIKQNSILLLSYSELFALRNDAQLMPGQQYRITDYVTTTVQENTQSAGHQFDIIVTADDESTLNEVARAIQHDGDTYFSDAGANLDAWKLWYCLDNDTNKFEWADSTNGKGVIYRMIDEFNNDCPYDFKNIQFRHPKDTTTYPDYYYTFSTVINGVITDHSILQNYCHDNTIKECINVGGQTLNNIVFLNTSKANTCNSNTFGINCTFNSFGNNCSNNTFEINCTFNSFGNNCSSNSFGNECYDNSIDSGSNNSFGDNCYGNSLGVRCHNNSFGNTCYIISFGDRCSSNSFGNNCSSNSFGDRCSSNSFGNSCMLNSFGNSCETNSFGNNCSSNSFGHYCSSNSFGNSCSSNSIRESADITSTLNDYIQYNHFDDGCSYNVIYNKYTTSSSRPLKNINVNRGVAGTNSSYNFININTINSEQEINVDNINGYIYVFEGPEKIYKTTYKDLVSLRNTSQLIPGTWYRITDYVTTTSQENTQSAGHRFDVLVLATSFNRLSEEAKAMLHEGDTYFSGAGANLNAWKLWYCLDNDTDRFAWAEDKIITSEEVEVTKHYSSECTINSELIDGNSFITPFNFESCVWVDGDGDGDITYEDDSNHDEAELVYEWGYFTDENNNTQLCLYKSDAGLYEEEGQPDYEDKYLYRGVVNVDGEEYDYWQKWDNSSKSININGTGDYVYATTPRIVSNPEAYSFETTNETIETITQLNPKGVIYRMIDERGNDCPYDFKNIQFRHPKDMTTYPDYYYTFSTVIDGVVTDHSILQDYCYGNTMKEYTNDSRYHKSYKHKLNNNVFLNTSKTGYCYSNSFGTNCYDNSFGSICYTNTFGNECYSNSFGHSCRSNTFGNECYNNSIGDDCSTNTFGNGCYSNSFGNECWSNSFGNNCNNNTIEFFSQYNTFGNNCNSNSFGTDCYGNSFGNNCMSNTFGNNCNSNSFGNGCRHNSFRVSSDISSSLKDYIQYNHFDDGCSYNIIWNSDTTSFSIQLNNINVNRGVVGTNSSYNTINIDVLNQNYEIQVAKNSKGEIKIYCEADLIA